MDILLVFRKPFPSSYSIEYLFNSLYAEFRRRSLPIHKYELPHHSNSIPKRIRNTLALLRLKAPIVHVTGDVHYVLPGALFARRILTIHDIDFIHRTKGLTRWLYRLFWITIPVRQAHIVTVISHSIKEDLLRQVRINPRKIRVIHDFVDDIYQPVPRTFHRDKPRILQIGTKYNKNLAAVARALKDIPCELIVIGKVPHPIQAILRANDTAFLQLEHLSMEDLHAQFVQADLLMFVSIREGFGMPILEAQATGLPVLTSDCSSMPEVAGPGAFFANPMDSISIRDGLLTLIHDETLRQEKVLQGYENVRRFSKAEATRQYLQIYQELSH